MESGVTPEHRLVEPQKLKEKKNKPTNKTTEQGGEMGRAAPHHTHSASTAPNLVSAETEVGLERREAWDPRSWIGFSRSSWDPPPMGVTLR